MLKEMKDRTPKIIFKEMSGTIVNMEVWTYSDASLTSSLGGAMDRQE